MSLPDFVIIGAMKCGTSTLHAQLAEQPGFFMSEPKEPNFFSDDAVFAKGIDWYRALFADAPAGAIKGESSTHYTKLPTHPYTVERLAAAAPDAKFVYVMRHPVDRLVSHYVHEWTQGVISGPIDDAIDRHRELVDYSRYAFQLAPWIERFGNQRILPVFFERMTAAPGEELRRIARFVGADGHVEWRSDLGAQNVSAERIRKFPGYNLLIENPAATFVRRRLAPQWLRDKVKSNLQMRERPQLSAASLERLTAVFDADLKSLCTQLDASLSCENFTREAAAKPLAWRR